MPQKISNKYLTKHYEMLLIIFLKFLSKPTSDFIRNIASYPSKANTDFMVLPEPLIPT